MEKRKRKEKERKEKKSILGLRVDTKFFLTSSFLPIESNQSSTQAAETAEFEGVFGGRVCS